MTRSAGRALVTGLLGLCLCLAGATFDSPSLYVPGVALALLAGGAVAWVELAARGARLSRRAGPASVVEEEPYPLRVRVTSGLLPAPGGELWEPLLGRPVPIAWQRMRRVRVQVRFGRRGRRVLAPPTLTVRDPLGLCVRTVAGEGGEEVLVLPRTEPVRSPTGDGGAGGDTGAGGGDAGAAGRRIEAAAAELEIDGLRPYRPGSPASRIHWPAVARTGEMMERRLVADLDAAPLVVLDASSPADEESLDKAVRAAASLCLHLARKGGCAVLPPGERRLVELGRDLGAWPALHARLAVVEAGPAPRGTALGPRAGAVLWVTGADLQAAPRLLERLPAMARYVVSPSPPGAAHAAFTVAGCTGVLVERTRRLGSPRREAAA